MAWGPRHVMRRWFDRAVLRVVRQFRVRIDRYKLVSKRTLREELLRDPVVERAIREHCEQQGTSEMDARVRVEGYVEEIVPYFNVLTYYRFGYNVARVLVNLLYRVSSEYQDEAALNAIPRKDVVIYVMNHRSNADYVVVAYVLARQVSISYAVGEWARVWPLEYVFKSFGAYFVRRRFREKLYHTVLERYVKLITRNGVTQGIFLEGGLTRDGALRPPKLGLLDYMARTLTEPGFERDIWFVPVALNYDRVLEDRSLIMELLEPPVRLGRARQLGAVLNYLGSNLLRLVTGNLKRYGRAAVNFGTPLSLRSWLRDHPNVLTLPKAERLPRLELLANELMRRIGAVIPVTPVPLVAATLLSFDETVVAEADVLERLDEMRDHLIHSCAKLVRPERDPREILDRAWRTLRMRRLVVRQGGSYVVLPNQRPLLEYYANSVRHLLPVAERRPAMTPAGEPDLDLPRLRRQERR